MGFPIGAPIRMLIVVQPPVQGVVGTALSASVVVAFMDAFGNLVSAAGTTVTATADTGTMSGTTAVQADANGAEFSNLVFDDIADKVFSTRRIVFSATGFASVTSEAVVIIDGSVKIWNEADHGVVDAAGVGLTTWPNRQTTIGGSWVPGTSMTAPVYRSTGFGGAALPYWEFNNAHGMMMAASAARALGDFTVFVVGLREVADSNGNWYETFFNAGGAVGQGLRPNGAAIYVGRQPGIPLVETSYNDPGTWLTTNVRKLFRHEFDGNNSGHKLFDNGVQKVFGTNGLVQNPGTAPTNALEWHIGYRNSATPTLHWRGKLAALIACTPKLTTPKAQSVELYLQKWLASGPAVPTAFRGPILVASQVIDGVTVQVFNWQASGTPDFASMDARFGYLTFAFSEPIKRFRATLVFGQSAPPGINWFRTVFGVRNYTGPYSWDFVCGGGYAPDIDNQTMQINDTVTGFTHVITSLAPLTASGLEPTSVFKDCYFSKMSDP